MHGGIAINTIKLAIVILTCGLFCLMGTSMAVPYHDWLSPGGVATVHHTTLHPITHYITWYYPAPYFSWYSPVVYNSFDPWWVANVYGPVRTTYYWGW